ncbi:MAG: DnaA/Hda family protein [Planctomycetaceae bacterium]
MLHRSDETFGRYVLLPESQFAANALARLRETSAPMVTLFGPSGIGKTHLIRQTVSELQHDNRTRFVTHLTAKELESQFTKASLAESIRELQDSLRQSDLFVCEDLHSLEGRLQTQQQLVAILDEVLSNGGRVLLSCRKSPGELDKFSPKLRNRLLGGICAHMPFPAQVSRQKLLLHFASANGLKLEEDLAEMIAMSMAVSPRELRGFVTQLLSITHQRREPVSREIVSIVLKNRTLDHKPSLPQITKLVASEFDTTVSALRSAGRVRTVVIPRQIAMFAAREWGQRAYADVGRYFGCRSHSTIVHACQRVRERLESDSAFRQQVDGLRDRLQTT